MSEHYLETMYKRPTPIAMAHRRRLEAIRRTFARIDVGPGDSTWADFGCSTGYVIEYIAGRDRSRFSRIVGYDDAVDVLEEARAKNLPGVEFRRLSLSRLQEPQEQFDVVSCFETLEHVPDFRIAVANLYVHVKAGGAMVISIPNEIGLVGLGKFFGRMLARRSPYEDFFAHQSRARYVCDLLLCRPIGGYRAHNENGYGPHLGFDYRDVLRVLRDEYVAAGKLSSMAVRSVAWNTGKIITLCR